MFKARLRDAEELSLGRVKMARVQEDYDHPLGEPKPVKKVEQRAEKASSGTDAMSSGTANMGGNLPAKKKVMDDPLSVFSSVKPGMDPLSMGASSSSSAKKVVSDPLSDPLSAMSLGSGGTGKSGTVSSSSSASSSSSGLSAAQQAASDLAMEQEAERNRLVQAQQRFKERIRNDYKFTGNITLKSNNMESGNQGLIVDGGGVSSGTADKYEDRLRNLEKKNERYDYVELSQKDYEEHVLSLRKRLDVVWARDERLQSLKLAIQIAKLLGDSTVPVYYPTIFVMVTDALEDFGDKVFQRLRRKCEETLQKENPPKNPAEEARQRFPEDFTVADVPQATKEIARNWFYKASCIRELVPRIYVEVTLARCYKFLMDESKYQNELDRIALQMRGFGDPLIATYGRAYLVHIGERLVGRVPQSPCPDFTFQALEDTCQLHACLLDESLKKHIVATGITLSKYKGLMVPAIEWLLMSVANGATKDTFRKTLAAYQMTLTDKKNYSGGNAVLLKFIIDCFDASMYSASTVEMAALVKNASQEDAVMSPVMLYTSLCKKLSLHPPPDEDSRNKLLNSTWRAAMASGEEELVPFVQCSAAVLELIQRHYSGHEIPKILQDLVNRIDGREDKVPEAVVRQFETIIVNLFSAPATMFSRILTSDSLLKMLDVFKGPKRITVCQQILQALKGMPRTGDPILIATLFEIGRSIHDSIDRLTAEVDVNYSSVLISAFIGKIDFGNDLEQQLSSYVECRGAFTNLDRVQDKLVLCVSSLAMKANALVKGKHSRKTTAFVKACLAFCHITIPSISAALRKLDLTVHCAQVALQCQCLPQTDTLLRTTAKFIPEVPTHVIDSSTGRKIPTSDQLLESLRVLLSFLVVVPGNPEFGPFYIVNMLLKELPRYAWPTGSTYRPKIFTDILVLLCTYAQETHPYSVPNVESNDVLYSGDDEYREELDTRIQQCMTYIETQLTEFESDGSSQLNQARLILSLVNQLACHVELTDQVASYILKLMVKANTRKSLFTRADQRFFASTLDYLKQRAQICGSDVLREGLAK